MRKPVQLNGPGVSLEDIAREFRISPKRQAALHEIVLAHVEAERSKQERARKRSASKKKAAGRKK